MQLAYEQAIQNTNDISIEQAKRLLWSEVGHQAKKVEKVYNLLGESSLSKIALRSSDLEGLSKLKLEAFYHEKDWATIWQAQSKSKVGELNEFYDYIEGVREPELAMKRRAELCAKQRKQDLEQKVSWVERNQQNRKRSYNFYKRASFSL